MVSEVQFSFDALSFLKEALPEQEATKPTESLVTRKAPTVEPVKAQDENQTMLRDFATRLNDRYDLAKISEPPKQPVVRSAMIQEYLDSVEQYSRDEKMRSSVDRALAEAMQPKIGESPSRFSPATEQQSQPSMDARSNELLEKPLQEDDSIEIVDAPDAQKVMPTPPEVKEEGLMSDPRGNKRPKARPTDEVEDTSLSDDDMGLPTRSVPDYNFMLPDSKFRRALKDKEAESYSTLFGNSEKKQSPFKGTDVTKMTMQEVLEFVKPNGDFHKYNKSTFGKNTTAIGKYQFVGATLRDLAKKERGVFKELGITKDTLFDEDTQDKLAAYMAIHRLKDRSSGSYSSGRKELRNEWEGFKKISDEELDSVIDEISSEIGYKPFVVKPKARPNIQVASN